jgi:mannose-1-phosphate guanylyltransferase
MAREFIARGNFLWNSGMFCFKATVFLEELNLYAPEVYETSNSLGKQSGGKFRFGSLWLFLLLVLIML